MKGEAGFSGGSESGRDGTNGVPLGQSHGQAREGLSILDLGGAGNRVRQRVKQGEDTRLNLSLLVLRASGSFNRENQ